MSGTEKIELSIFNPFSEYFKILHNVCETFDNACVDKNLSDIVTNKCDASGTKPINSDVSDNFKTALNLFALNLKTFDYPISQITIKGQLYDNFLKAFKENGYNFDDKQTKSTPLNNPKLTTAIDKMKTLSIGILNMDEAYSLDKTIVKTYAAELDDLCKSETLPTDRTVKDLLDKIFDTWINKVFNIYGDSKTRFDLFLDDLVTAYRFATDKTIEPSHISAFNIFFQLLDDASLPVETDPSRDKNIWGIMIEEIRTTGKLTSFYGKYRINIKVVREYKDLLKPYSKPNRATQKLQAGIVFAFPKSVQNEFNDALIRKVDSRNARADANDKKNFYTVRAECKKGAYTLDADQVKSVLNFMKRSGPTRGVPYEDEYKETEEYSDGSKSYSYDEFKNIVDGYSRTWARDYQGNYYTRIDDKGKIGKSFKLYGEDRLKEDIESFKTGTGNCGHLCIFSDPVECEKFFKDMVESKPIGYDRLAKMVNGNTFMNDFSVLKDNIVKVNPAFVIGTLRAFKFEKWEKLNSDGTKSIKVESFSRWWTRVGQNFMKDGASSLPTGTKTHKLVDPVTGKEVTPEPPQNLELFLKLLVSFINNNDFVLNPQSSHRIISNRLPITSSGLNDYGDEPATFTIIENGKTITIPNSAYGKVKELNAPNLARAFSEIKKNGSLRAADPGLPENRSILNALWGLSVGINGLGKMSFAAPRTTTGLSYYGHYGGYKHNHYGGTDLADLVKEWGPCSKTAYEGLMHAKAVLKNKGKSFDDKLFDDLIVKIKEMANLESELYIQLSLIANYEKVISSLTDGDDGVSTVTNDYMKDAVKEYEARAKIVSDKSDAFTSIFMNIMNSRTGSSSGYSGPL
jgi:hypothetical protein